MTTTHNRQRIASQWARLGILLDIRPIRGTPDLERLLLDTARAAPGDARLFYLAVSWLSRYGSLVARHRLKHLVGTELAAADQPVLGALLGLAVRHGATRELLVPARACTPAEHPRPSFDVYRGPPALERRAESSASPAARPWNLWVPEQAPKLDALRPTLWLLDRNPELRARGAYRGDLRSTILLTLRLDVPGRRVASEVELADRCSASRLAVRKALDDLELEGLDLRRREPGRRRIAIELGEAA
jgi:biotin operon repressor